MVIWNSFSAAGEYVQRKKCIMEKYGVNGTSEVVIDQDGKVDLDHSA
jgi:hypothetical protein